MTTLDTALLVLSALLGAGTAHGQGPVEPPEHGLARRAPFLFSTTTDHGGGVVSVTGGPPWSAATVTPGVAGRVLRSFGGELFVVDADGGAIWRVDPAGAAEPEAFHVGLASAPQDVHVVRGRIAWVTRGDQPLVARIDLATGAGLAPIDLGDLAEPGETATLGTLERDGDRLFVQVALTLPPSAAAPGFPDRGVLAVIDLSSGQVLDLDPVQPGVQGVELLGAPPHLKMQVVERTLFVSTTAGRLDNRGGIERVDLDGLVSLGFALSEDVFGADLGGFVMTSADEGYFVFHTDIVQSTHLERFTLSGGAEPGPETFFLLGDTVDSMAFDPVSRRIFVPSGFAGFGAEPGIYVVDADANLLLEGGPIHTGTRPQDVIALDP